LPENRFEEAGLSGAVGAKHGKELTLPYFQVQPVPELAVTERQ
jgi:hypothetical protein